MQAPALAEAPTAAEGEQIDVIQLVTNRASAPSLGDFLAELHNSDVLSDITICSEDGQAIKCHKLVLIRWSAPFRRMLCGGKLIRDSVTVPPPAAHVVADVAQVELLSAVPPACRHA